MAPAAVEGPWAPDRRGRCVRLGATGAGGGFAHVCGPGCVTEHVVGNLFLCAPAPLPRPKVEVLSRTERPAQGGGFPMDRG